MKSAVRSTIWGVVSGVMALAVPLHAQSLAEIPVEQRLQVMAKNQQARTLMEVYGISTFAAGADESCQLFDVGELRAFQVLKGQIGGGVTLLWAAASLPKEFSPARPQRG